MINELIGQTLAGKYRIEEPLRRDAFGVTYRATHVLMEKLVAVKILNPALAADAGIVLEFQQEAKMLSRLSHPHVLSVTDYGADDARAIVFLVMENFDGRSLKDLIEEEKQIPLGRAIGILEQTASALDAAHGAGIVHGGLRSDSVLLSENRGKDWVKVVDFDHASKTFETNRLDGGDSDAAENAVFYFSPEQAMQTNEADARSDIYALGVILFEALTGRLPFTGANGDEVRRKHAEEIPPSLLALRPELPPALEQVVQRALAKQPAQRFQTAADFTEALVNAADNAPVSSWREQIPIIQPPAHPAAGAGQYADGRWRTAFIVLAGISLLSAGLFFFTQSRRTVPGTFDPNMQPVQPINPATGQAEQQQQDLSNTQFPPLGNSDLPTVVIPGGQPSGGGGDVPPTGRIPPGLYNGQVYTIDNSGSIFMQDLNANTSTNRNPANNNPANKNANASQANNKPANSGANSGAATTTPTPGAAVTPTPKPAASPKTGAEKPAPKQTPKPADKAPDKTGDEQ